MGQRTNWARNVGFSPKLVHQPNSTGQVAELLASTTLPFRSMGTAHSWNAQMATDQLLIETHQLSGLLHVDHNNLRVTVAAGTKLKHLSHLLWAQGLCLRNLGSIAEQSLAGAIATGTHGSGIEHRILADQMQSFTLVTPQGEVKLIDRDLTPTLFNLGAVNLGLWGVVTEITLNVMPATQLHEQSGLMPFDAVCDQLPQLVKAHDHLKLWWWPHTDKLMVYRYNRTTQPANDPRWRQWLMDEFLAVYFYRGLLAWGNTIPDHRPVINRAICAAFMKPIDRIERSYRVFNVPEPPLHRETEWAFDINLAPDILRSYRAMVKARGHRVNFIQEVRFTKADPFALSPCHGRDSVWVGAYQADHRNWSKLLFDFEALAREFGGRPHWGKEFSPLGSELRQFYPRLNEFMNVRNELDPGQRLINPYFAQLFDEK